VKQFYFEKRVGSGGGGAEVRGGAGGQQGVPNPISIPGAWLLLLVNASASFG